MTMKKVRPIDANKIHFTRVLSKQGLDMELAAKCTIDSMPTLDYEPVVYCDDCVNHGCCTVEDTFRFVRMERRFCAAGKKMDGKEQGQ